MFLEATLIGKIISGFAMYTNKYKQTYKIANIEFKRDNGTVESAQIIFLESKFDKFELVEQIFLPNKTFLFKCEPIASLDSVLSDNITIKYISRLSFIISNKFTELNNFTYSVDEIFDFNTSLELDELYKGE